MKAGAAALSDFLGVEAVLAFVLLLLVLLPMLL